MSRSCLEIVHLGGSVSYRGTKSATEVISCKPRKTGTICHMGESFADGEPRVELGEVPYGRGRRGAAPSP